MDSVVVKSLLAPFRLFISCMTETLQRDIRGSGGQRSQLMDHNPTILQDYQAELEKERKLCEVRNIKKNAERAAMRAHFRKKYQLPKNAEDSRCIRAVVETVEIPCHLMVRSETPEEERSRLLSVFQNLNFSTDFTHKH